MFEDLKKNLEHEKRIVTDMRSIAIGYRSDPANRDFYRGSLRALAEQLDMLNNAVPSLLREWIPISGGEVVQEAKVREPEAKKPEVRNVEVGKPKLFASQDVALRVKGEEYKRALPVEVKAEEEKVVRKVVLRGPPASKEREVVKMSYVSPSDKEKKFVTINKKDKVEFLKKLKLSEDALKGLKKVEQKKVGNLKNGPNPFIVFSSKYFGRVADKISPQFADVSRDLKSANIPILLSSYLATAIMSSLIAFVVGVVIFVALLVVSLSNWMFVFLPIGFVGLTMAGFYLYPASEASGVQKNITYELPFATIHMAAIAGSNITPVKIFKIIAGSVEYRNIGAEMRKVVTQIEVYGYDIVSALKAVAKTSQNKKLSELFSGLATNIASGGALKNYLEKKAESFLTDYRLERQKYAALAGTFMDVYISILIAAPLVLMMMFIVMNVAGLGMGGLSITMLMGLAIMGIIVVNIIFMVVLNLKQPKV